MPGHFPENACSQVQAVTVLVFTGARIIELAIDGGLLVAEPGPAGRADGGRGQLD
jgi:hypothetical protein